MAPAVSVRRLRAFWSIIRTIRDCEGRDASRGRNRKIAPASDEQTGQAMACLNAQALAQTSTPPPSTTIIWPVLYRSCMR